MLMRTIVLLLFVLISPAFALSEVANYPTITQIKSGEHKLTLSTLTGPTTHVYQQPYQVATINLPVNIAIALLVFEAQTSGRDLGFSVIPSAITRTSFNSTLTIFSNSKINELRYMYIVIMQAGAIGYAQTQLIEYTSLANLTGRINDSHEIIQNLNQTYNLSSYVFIPMLNAFHLEEANDDLSVRVEAEPHNEFQVKITVFSNCTVRAVSFYLIWADKAEIQSSHIYYLDTGSVFGANNGTTYQRNFETPAYNYYNSIGGASWIAFKFNQSIFSINLNTNPFSSLGSYKYIKANILHWRKRQCSVHSNFYYLHAHSKCYDNCPQRYASVTESTTYFCLPCHYSCLECLSDGLTCTVCSNTSEVFRSMENGSCLCVLGYFDKNVQVCEMCDYTCESCSVAASNCETCDSTRNLTNNTCPCDVRFFDTLSNNPICSPCHYSCLTCVNTSTTCTSCNETVHRQLTSNKKCLCSSGFYEPVVGNEECASNPSLVCSTLCQTCNGTSTSCTSCPSNINRVLLSNSCVCIPGYTSVGNARTCTQICGDGQVHESECDDGNTVSGDGCSSTCTVEANYDCDNTTVPTLCVYQFGYTIKLISLTKKPLQNKLNLNFTITPSPPKNSIPRINNIPNVTATYKLTTSVSSPLSSQNGMTKVGASVSKAVLIVILEYAKSIPDTTFASLSINNVGTSEQFQVIADNKLAINYYEPSNYNLSFVEAVMVYVLIGIIWIGVIIFLIVDHSSILMVTELLMSIGATWIGAASFSQYLIFYYPLTFLQYIFGYNYKVPNEDGLLAFVNYGFLLFLIPPFIVLVFFIIGKLKPQLAFSQATKLFTLFELSFALLAFNSIIVVYGLYTETFTKTFNTPLSIASLAVGIVYLLILLIASIFFTIKEDSYIFFKIPMRVENKKGPIFFCILIIWVRLLVLMMHLMLSYYLPTNPFIPLIVAGFALITIISSIIIKPYDDNVRVLFNQSILIIVFLSYFLIKQIPSAEWSGFAVLMLLYIQVSLNFVSMGRNAYRNMKKKQYESESEEEEETVEETDSVNSKQKGDEEFEPRTQKRKENNEMDNNFEAMTQKKRENNEVFIDYEPRVHKRKQILQPTTPREALDSQKVQIRENMI